jgi:hypothetical protein
VAKGLSSWGRAIRPGRTSGEVVAPEGDAGGVAAAGASRTCAERGKSHGDRFWRNQGRAGPLGRPAVALGRPPVVRQCMGAGEGKRGK